MKQLGIAAIFWAVVLFVIVMKDTDQCYPYNEVFWEADPDTIG